MNFVKLLIPVRIIIWSSLIPHKGSFEIEGKRYDVVEIDRPECGYLMLEILSKEKNILRGIHIIKMEGKSNIRLVLFKKLIISHKTKIGKRT